MCDTMHRQQHGGAALCLRIWSCGHGCSRWGHWAAAAAAIQFNQWWFGGPAGPGPGPAASESHRAVTSLTVPRTRRGPGRQCHGRSGLALGSDEMGGQLELVRDEILETDPEVDCRLALPVTRSPSRPGLEPESQSRTRSVTSPPAGKSPRRRSSFRVSLRLSVHDSDAAAGRPGRRRPAAGPPPARGAASSDSSR